VTDEGDTIAGDCQLLVVGALFDHDLVSTLSGHNSGLDGLALRDVDGLAFWVRRNGVDEPDQGHRDRDQDSRPA